MSEYILLAENITFKNNKLSCINIFDSIQVIAMPAEFIFDMVIMCGPHWKSGVHKLAITTRVNNSKEIPIGKLEVNIMNENYVHNAVANNLKLVMDSSVKDITFVISDDGQEVLTRTYPVSAMLVQKPNKKQ